MQQSAMRLVELGPRLTLEIVKVENGFGEGDVLYHKYVSKTQQEAKEIKEKVRLLYTYIFKNMYIYITLTHSLTQFFVPQYERKMSLKAERRQAQEENVKRKRESEEQRLKEKAERKRAKYAAIGGGEVDDSESDKDGRSEEGVDKVGNDDENFDSEYEADEGSSNEEGEEESENADDDSENNDDSDA